jgi:DNA-binding PadR family transcriptional regulator
MSIGTAHFALLGLISSRDHGIHGYQLKSEFEDRFGDYWAVTFGQVYRLLDRLERTGFIAGADVPQVGRPPRKVYRITDRGRRTLQDWLALPPSDGPKALRDDLVVKLLFRSGAQPADALDLVIRHRSLCLRHLSRLNRRRARLENTSDAVATNLLLLQADMRVRSDLAWLDIVEQEIRKGLEGGRRLPDCNAHRSVSRETPQREVPATKGGAHVMLGLLHEGTARRESGSGITGQVLRTPRPKHKASGR